MDNEEQFFSTQLAAVEFLKQSGYKVSRSGFNKDFKAGLVPCTSDKRFSASELIAYAERKLAIPVPADQRMPKETPLEDEVTSDGIRVFQRQIHAVNFLHENGYKISSSKFNRDFNEGRIPCTTDKRFLATELLAYAERELAGPPQVESAAPASDVRVQETELSKELRGLCLGIMADGQIVQSEAEFLADWLDRHINPVVTEYGILQLGRRIRAMLDDGDFSSQEAKELSDLLHRLVLPDHTASATQKRTCGEAKKQHRPCDPYHSADSLELISPREDIFDHVTQVDFSLNFCLTGIFAMGDRKACEHQTAQAGGTILGHPVKYDCYLVVGSIASPEWKHGNYGTKIEKALQYKTAGGSIRIISEDVWAESLVP